MDCAYITSVIKSGPNVVRSFKGMADELNRYYRNKIEDLNNSIPAKNQDPLESLRTRM